MTLSEYFAAVKLILVNKYHLAEGQAMDVVRANCADVNNAWEHGVCADSIASELKSKEDGFKHCKASADKDLLVAAIKCLSEHLTSEGHNASQILSSNGIDVERIQQLIGGKQ